MHRLFFCALWLASSIGFAAGTCNGTSAVGTFRLLVKSPAGTNPLPMRSLNNIAENSKISYEPIQLPDSLKKNGKLTLVVVPSDGDQRAVAGATVLEPKPAGSTGEWTAPFRIGTVLFVFAPQGLDEKRVANLVSRDEELIEDLARYAERTVQLENTIETLNVIEDQEEPIEDPMRSLRGNPTEQALFTLTRALNPSSTYFNPLNGGRTVGPQTRSGLAADVFFENAGGLFPGGGALSMAKTWLLPDSEFRTVYAETAPPDGLTLCAQKTLSKTRNRLVYLWGYQLTNTKSPKFAQSSDLTLAAGTRSTLPIKTQNPQEWPLLDRVRDWSLVNTATNREISVTIRSLVRGWGEIDLRKTDIPAGSYKLRGRWDWDVVTVDGTWRVSVPGDLKQGRLTGESEAKLVENSGLAPVEIEGTDFQFVDRVRLKRAGTLGAMNTDLEFRLPQGFRGGSQNKLELEVNTDTFHTGNYLLSVQQINGKSADIPMRIAPVPPRVSNLPIRLNLGEPQQRVTLMGTDLDRLPPSIQTPEGVKVQMLDGSDTERDAMVMLASAGPNLKRGAKLRAAGSGLVFQVAGPKPKVISAAPALPDDLPAALREGELPSGALVSFTIRAENVEAPATLVANCSDATRSLGALKIRLGERRAGGVKFDAAAGTGTYFASFDPGSVGQSGCELQLSIESDAAGTSAPLAAGRVVRLPRILSMTWTEEKSTGGYVAILRGTDLEVIEKAGWDGQPGIAISNAPKSSGDSTQTLRVSLPWPPPSPLAPVVVWLRGDSQQQTGRKSVIQPIAK